MTATGADDAGTAATSAADGGQDADRDDAAPTPGSDNDGAEAGYTPPSATEAGAGSDDPVTD